MPENDSLIEEFPDVEPASMSGIEEFPDELPQRGGYWTEAARGLTQFAPALVKTTSTVGDKLGNLVRRGVGLEPLPLELPEERPLYKVGQWMQDKLDTAYPAVPEPKRNLGHDVASGLGQMGSMLAGGLGARAAGATLKGAAAVGTALGFSQEFDDAFSRARQRGDDPDTALWKSLGYASLAAMIENKLGAGRIIKKYFPDPAEAAKKLSAWGVSKATAISLAVGFGEEGSQRFAQNWIVEGKPSLEGIVEEGTPGGIVQAIAELPAHLLRGRGGKIRTPIPRLPVPPPADVQTIREVNPDGTFQDVPVPPSGFSIPIEGVSNAPRQQTSVSVFQEEPARPVQGVATGIPSEIPQPAVATTAKETTVASVPAQVTPTIKPAPLDSSLAVALPESVVESMSLAEQSKLKHGNGIEVGLTLSEADVPRLQGKYDVASEQMKAAVASGNNEEFTAAFGRLNFFGGALMGATRGKHPISGSNYERFIKGKAPTPPVIPPSAKVQTGSSPGAALGALTPPVSGNTPAPSPGALEYPLIKPGAMVDGRQVINANKVPNMSSIGASIDNPEVLPGIREVPMSEFTLTGKHYSVQGQKKIDALADAIRESNEITPLIVVRDSEGSYILEGATRADALFKLGAKSFPAVVVLEPPATQPETKPVVPVDETVRQENLRKQEKPKPLNMAGQVRPERPKPTPVPAFTEIHPKSREKFNTAWDARSTDGMQALLHPDNKGMRAEWENRTGNKLPKGVRDTDKAIANYFESLSLRDKPEGATGAGSIPAAGSTTPPASDVSPKPVKPLTTLQQLDALVIQHGLETGRIDDLETLHAPKITETSGLGSMGLAAKRKYSEQIKTARERIASDLGVAKDKLQTLEGRAELLAKLKERIASIARLESVALESMPEGSTFTIHGEKFTVKGTDQDTGIVTLKDGKTLKVDERSAISIDPGSLKATQVWADKMPTATTPEANITERASRVTVKSPSGTEAIRATMPDGTERVIPLAEFEANPIKDATKLEPVARDRRGDWQSVKGEVKLTEQQPENPHTSPESEENSERARKLGVKAEVLVKTEQEALDKINQNQKLGQGPPLASLTQSQKNVLISYGAIESVRNKFKRVSWERLAELGETDDWREAGYISPEGGLIDLSGKSEGGSWGMRSYDHREAGGTAGMIEAMAAGFIRMSVPRGGGHSSVNLLAKPTRSQKYKLLELFRVSDGNVVLDLGDGAGEWDSHNERFGESKRSWSNEYDQAESDAIWDDIEAFYSGRRPGVGSGELSASHGAEGEVAGYYHNGIIYYILDNIRSPEQFLAVQREEIAHHINSSPEAKKVLAELGRAPEFELERREIRGSYPKVESETVDAYSERIANEMLAKSRVQDRGLFQRMMDWLIEKLSSLPRFGDWIRESASNRQAILRTISRRLESNFTAAGKMDVPLAARIGDVEVRPEDAEETRAQHAGIPESGQLRPTEHLDEIRKNVRANIIDSTQPLTPELLEKAWQIENELTDPTLRHGKGLEYYNLLGSTDAGLVTLQEEIIAVAMKAAANGDTALLYHSFDHSADFEILAGGGGRTAAGRALRGAQGEGYNAVHDWLKNIFGDERMSNAQIASMLDRETFFALFDALKDGSLRPAEGIGETGTPQSAKALAEAQEKIARRILAGKDPKTQADLIDLIISGILDPTKHWVDELAKRRGWKKPTTEQYAKLVELAEQLGDPALSPEERKAIVEQQHAIIRHLGKHDKQAQKAIAESFMASLLTGFRTFTVQFAAGIMTLRDLAIQSAFDPKNSFNFLRSMNQAFRHNVVVQAKYSWQKDISKFHLNDLDNNFKELERLHADIMETFKTGTLPQKAIAAGKWIYAQQRFALRLLQTMDNVSSSFVREYKIAYYSSLAMKEAGLTTHDISTLLDAQQAFRQAEYERWTNAGLGDTEAQLRANATLDQTTREFLSNKGVENRLIDAVFQSAENDSYLAVGRKAKGIKEQDEGLLSKPMNWVLEVVGQAKAKGGWSAIGAQTVFGFVAIPWRATRFASTFMWYGLVRHGIDGYRKRTNRESYWKQSYGNVLQSRARLREALAGTVVGIAAGVLMGLHGSGDDDAGEEDFSLYITGEGPASKNLRDAWTKRGFKPYALNLVVNSHIVPIPLTRIGEFIMYPFIIAAAIDQAKWKAKERAASGQPAHNPISLYASSMVGEHLSMMGQRGLLQTAGQLYESTRATGSFGKGVARVASSTASGIILPFKQLLASISEMFVGPLDNSSATAIIANSLPIVGLPFQNPAVNRFGDAMYDRSWYGRLYRTGIPIAFQVSKSPENETLYPTLVSQGAAPPELKRATLEKRFGPMTDAIFGEFARRSGAILKRQTVANIPALKEMKPEDAKEWLSKAATRADRQTELDMGLQRVKPLRASGGGGGYSILGAASVPRGITGTISQPRSSSRRVSFGSRSRRTSLRSFRTRGRSRIRRPRLTRLGSRNRVRRVRLYGSRMRRPRLRVA